MKDDARTDDNAETEILGLLQDAAVLRLAAGAFAYPDAERRSAIDRGFAEITTTQATRLATAAWASPMLVAHARWKDSVDTIEGEYIRLFLGSAPCPLHETAYGDGRRMGGRVVELADIAGFYRAFGFTLSETTRDLPDHLSAELEFAAALLLKEAYALAEGLDEERDVTRQAGADFLLAHLGRWTGALREGLVEAGAHSVFLALADFVVAAVASRCEQSGVAPVLSQGRFEDEGNDDGCITCPMVGAEPVH